MIRTLSFFLFFSVFVLISNKVSAQDSSKHFLSKKNIANFYGKKVATAYSILSPHFKQYQIVKISSAAIAAALTENNNTQLNIGLQINDELGFNLQLVQNDIIASNYILTTQTSQGKITTQLHPVCFYKGKVNDTVGGDARLCIKEGFIYGYIKKGDKEYFIDPLNRYDNTLPKDEFIFYEAKDVVSKSMACGFNDLQQTADNIKNNDPYILSPTSPNGSQNAICKKVKFIIATDYSMYKAFNKNIDALQTFLLANLNMAEGLFNTLNLDSTIAGDVGTDLLNFEVTQIHTSVCDSCDFMGSSDQTGDILNAFAKWINENTIPGQAAIFQFWSTRNLRFGQAGYLGLAQPMFNSNPNCYYTWINLIKYFTEDAITLRLQVSHEAGHALGCAHDNEISPSVTGYIMNSSGTYIASPRFSRLSDFGGINYSSQKAIKTIVIMPSCFEDCSLPVCEAVTDLKINYYNSSDSIKISWAGGTGNYLVKYKIKDTINYDNANQYIVSGNEIVLNRIMSCTNYTVQIQKICVNNQLGRISSISFNSSPFTVTTSETNFRGDVYDLKLELECKNCDAKNVTVNIDHRPYKFRVNQFPSSVTIPDLFADGARHKIDYNGDNLNGSCKLQKYYHAPYYRENSTKIINDNFDSCRLSAEWKDSTLKTLLNNPPWKWSTGQFSGDINAIDNLFFFHGNLDSTCMAFNNLGLGSNALFSLPHVITKFKNVFLSFDYKYLCYLPLGLTNPPTPYFKVQVFDGNAWQNIFELTQTEIRPSGGRRRIWDTIPERKFINLDKYINNEFQIRFVLDDGGFGINPNTGAPVRALPFLYLDNIKVDGYDITNPSSENSFSIFPNPVRKDIFIKLNLVTAQKFQYKVADALGRILQQGKLLNFRINIGALASGIYFLALYNENGQFGKPVKFFKH